MKNSKSPTIFIFSGLPASGKSTLAKYVAKKYDAIYLRIDTIEQGLRDLCNLSVTTEGYGLAYKIAEDNLKLGTNVVADSCNPISITRNKWKNIAIFNKYNFLNIEIICSDIIEHKIRAESRESEIQNLKLATWSSIQNREYEVWTDDRIVVDTAGKNIGDTIIELFYKIQNHLY